MMESLIEINRCEVCENEDLKQVLDLGMHPLCDDLIPVGDKRVCKEYPIDIHFCNICKTAHQKYQVPKKELFQFDYHYRARMTGSVLSGMQDLVASIEDFKGDLSDLKVLDIGCNDGSLLDFFKDKGCQTFGVEPTSAASDSSHETINEFFDEDIAKQLLKKVGQFDLITFTNVFAHIEDLNSLLKNLQLILKKEGTLIIENHYLGAVLKTGQFDTFYHEHPRTYSEESFRYIAKKLNRNVSNIQYVSRYGGNIRVFIDNNPEIERIKDEETFESELFAMQDDIHSWKKEMNGIISSHNNEYGPIVAKAFPGRAAILIKLLGLDKSNISAVYEITGSIKVEHYVPGTRIPIKPEVELFNMLKKPEIILNLGWHISAEVKANLENNNVLSKIIDIKKPKV